MLLFIPLACRRPPAHVARVPAAVRANVAVAENALQIPRVLRAPVLELHDDETLWQQSVSTGPWLKPDTQEPARPYSQARLLWDADNLYLSLYAADQNIEALGAQHDEPLRLHDAFAVWIDQDGPTFAVDIAPTGTVTDLRFADGMPHLAWESGARVAMDMDGSLNDTRGEDDEEWVAFVALPWRSMGITATTGTRVHLQFERCDVPKDGVKRCGQWAQTVVLADASTAPTGIR